MGVANQLHYLLISFKSVIFFSILGKVPYRFNWENSLILPSVGKITDIYLKTTKIDEHIMISVTVICFLKVKLVNST